MAEPIEATCTSCKKVFTSRNTHKRWKRKDGTWAGNCPGCLTGNSTLKSTAAKKAMDDPPSTPCVVCKVNKGYFENAFGLGRLCLDCYRERYRSMTGQVAEEELVQGTLF